ncbi:hypothetical protein Q5P01_013548 [Channa striata]|uniref:Uncharacterized protein n=1 Tax=Channa striata TaxID=64152 RepID=A0AA88MKC5_CHASR|nr:hypothetical protein Q5P01_013548 [Channa striata]
MLRLEVTLSQAWLVSSSPPDGPEEITAAALTGEGLTARPRTRERGPARGGGERRVFRTACMSLGYGVLAALFGGGLHMVLGVKHGAMLDQLSLCCLPQFCARPTGEGQMRTLSPSSTAHHNMGLRI